MNYRIHTDAIKENLIPQTLSQAEINFVYADEADVLTNEVISWQRSHQRSEKFLYGRKYVVFTTDYHRWPQMTTDETTEIKG